MKLQSDDFLSKFYMRKSGEGSSFNYDIKELIKNFDFYEFVRIGSKRYAGDYSAFLVITSKQYIIGYTAGFGEGTHQSIFARVHKDLNGGGDINNYMELMRHNNDCVRKYITARILYEKIGTDENGRAKFDGSIHFNFPDRNINPCEYEVFKKFYEDYNDNIKFAIKKSNGTFSVSYHSKETGNKLYLDSLDGVLEFVDKKLDDSIEVQPSNEVILGTEVERTRMR